MKYRFLFLAFLICSLAFSQSKGTVSGTITDKDLNNEALPFASVAIKGTTIGSSTDADGKYSLNVEAGNHILVVSFVGYESAEIPVTVKAGETVTANKALGSGSVKLEDIVVQSTVNREKETALLLEQKQAVEIKQSIGAQEMSRKGVSDVEQGLTKITGITKVGSRGLFVRGLEDRYNNLLINGLAAPTNNPFKKIIPLDLFSTDIVGVIDVYKTFNPDIYGDFAGGTFNIQTSKASKSITKIELGAGYTTNLDKFLASEDADGAKGFFGFNGKDREIPSVLGNSATHNELTSGQSLKYFKSGFDVSERKNPLNTSIGLLHGEKFKLENDRAFSYLLSINFDNDYSQRSGVERTQDSPTLSGGTIFANDLVNTESRFKTATSSLLALNYTTNRLKLALNTVYIRTTENMIKDQRGTLNRTLENQVIRTNQLDKTDYLNTQLLGEFALNEAKTSNLKGGVSFAHTKYSQPDRKFFQGNILNDEQASVSYGAANFLRQYLTVDGNYFFSGMAEYSLKFGKGEDKQNKVSIGYDGNASGMESSYRFIGSYTHPGTPVPAFIANLNTIDTNIENDLAADKFYFQESSNSTYKVKLNEFTNAGYINLLLKFAQKWEVNGGVRFEAASRETKFRSLGSFDDPFLSRKYNNNYFLPSVNVKYEATEKSNIRFAASKTYTRPVVMEAFPLTYINADGTSVQGNPLLKNSDNYNFDLKLETFPTAKEMFAIGLFTKYIEHPIERTYVSNATTSTITTYLNSDKANLFGAEAEAVVGLERITPALSSFSFGLNASLMSTKVAVSPFYDSQDESGHVTENIPSIETHKSRELQGASKWLLNSDLKYQFNFDKDWSNTVSLVYSFFGKRIFAVGTNDLDHVYEMPFQQLDFVWSSKVSEHFGLKFSADNLLNPARKLEFGKDGTYEYNEDSYLANSYKKGVGFSLKIDYTF